jgi:TonB family protein
MSAALAQRRLGTAFAASLAVHASLAAGVAGLVLGGKAGDEPKAVVLVARLQSSSPVPAQSRPASASEHPVERAPHRGAAPGAPLPAPYYHRTSELSERPAPLEQIQPRFPEGAPETGRLKLRLYINERGLVDAVDITEAEPAGVFEEAAAEAFRAARFRPGYKDATPVKSQIALEVRFGEPLPYTKRPQ